MSIKRRLRKLELIGKKTIQVKEKKEKAITYWLESIKHEGDTITGISVLRHEPGGSLNPLDLAGYLEDIKKNEEAGRDWVFDFYYMYQNEMMKQGYDPTSEADWEKYVEKNDHVRETARLILRNRELLKLEA